VGVVAALEEGRARTSKKNGQSGEFLLWRGVRERWSQQRNDNFPAPALSLCGFRSADARHTIDIPVDEEY
jgi:hypothetical protein